MRRNAIVTGGIIGACCGFGFILSKNLNDPFNGGVIIFGTILGAAGAIVGAIIGGATQSRSSNASQMTSRPADTLIVDALEQRANGDVGKARETALEAHKAMMRELGPGHSRVRVATYLVDLCRHPAGDDEPPRS